LAVNWFYQLMLALRSSVGSSWIYCPWRRLLWDAMSFFEYICCDSSDVMVYCYVAVLSFNCNSICCNVTKLERYWALIAHSVMTVFSAVLRRFIRTANSDCTTEAFRIGFGSGRWKIYTFTHSWWASFLPPQTDTSPTRHRRTPSLSVGVDWRHRCVNLTLTKNTNLLIGHFIGCFRGTFLS